MRSCLIAIVTLAIFSIPSFSAATTGRPGPYVSAFLGGSFAKDITVSNYDSQAATSFSEKFKFDPGIYTGGTGGYDFGFVRLEGELSYRNAGIDSITSQSNNYSIHNVDGNLGVFASMINVFFDLHNTSRFTPYLGGGIGFATLSLSDTHGYVTRNGSTYYQPLYWASNDTVFAYQFGGGVDIALNNRYSLDVGYRYFKTDDAHFDSFYPITSSMHFESHNALVGFKFKF
jgi:opacity protein-like surface antigen